MSDKVERSIANKLILSDIRTSILRTQCALYLVRGWWPEARAALDELLQRDDLDTPLADTALYDLPAGDYGRALADRIEAVNRALKGAVGATRESRRLVLCQSADGWSLHAPGSTDDDIAAGDAPYLASGEGEPSEDDYTAACLELARRNK